MPTLFSQRTVKMALNEASSIRRLDGNHFRVARKAKGHSAYRVAYTLDKKRLPTIESCRDEQTGKQCKGFRFNDGECFHGAVTAIHVTKSGLK